MILTCEMSVDLRRTIKSTTSLVAHEGLQIGE